ncbi:MAG: hypothetical protein ACOCWO_05570, partial [Candidatus Muiribacteriaceae bacterium]
MRNLFLVMIILLTAGVTINASLNSIVPEEHYAYGTISDLTSRKLLVAPEIWEEGSILTRKDFAILSVMLLTNTDSDLYFSKLSYYDARKILQMVVDFSEEISFFFSDQMQDIEKRIQRLEKKIEMPRETVRAQKEIDLPETEKREMQEFRTRTAFDMKVEYFDSDNKEGFHYFYPEKAEETLTTGQLEVRSLDVIGDKPVFLLDLQAIYRGSESHVNGQFSYNDPGFDAGYSSYRQDEFFRLNQAGLTDDYAYYRNGRLLFVRRMNQRQDQES